MWEAYAAGTEDSWSPRMSAGDARAPGRSRAAGERVGMRVRVRERESMYER